MKIGFYNLTSDKLCSIIIFIFICLLFLFPDRMYAGSKENTQEEPKRIAVKEFDSTDKQLGKMLAEWTISVLFEKKDCVVVERVLLNQLLEEQKLSASGLIQQDKMIQIGNLAGASHILFGTIGKIGEKYLLTLKIVSVNSSETVESYRGTSNNLDNIPNVLVALLKKEQTEQGQEKFIKSIDGLWDGYFQYDDYNRGYIVGNFTVNFQTTSAGAFVGEVTEPRTDFGPQTGTLHSTIHDGYFNLSDKQISFTKRYDYDGHTVQYSGTSVGKDTMTGRWKIGSYIGSWRAFRRK